jgi:hypothetical protein
VAAAATGDPRYSSWGRDYWLRRCEGFVVVSGKARVGKVQGVRYERSTEPQLLEVRVGAFGRKLLLVPVEEVEAILPEEKRVVLHRTRAPGEAVAAAGARRT